MFTDIFTALFADLLIKLLLGLLIFQSLGFFWFIWVVLRFGLLRRDEPDQETLEILQDPELMQVIRAARRHKSFVELEEAMQALDLGEDTNG